MSRGIGNFDSGRDHPLRSMMKEDTLFFLANYKNWIITRLFFHVYADAVDMIFWKRGSCNGGRIGMVEAGLLKSAMVYAANQRYLGAFWQTWGLTESTKVQSEHRERTHPGI
eukprot:gene213-biopygen8937